MTKAKKEPKNSARKAAGETFARQDQTPPYLAQLMNDDRATINHLADLYGLGVTLYEMATGTVPFTGNSAQILIKHIQEPPMPPRARNKAVPPALNELILHLLQKKPENRPQSADEVGQLLEILNHLYRMEPLERRV